MPATETHTPEQWAAEIMERRMSGKLFAELAALKARADQAERMRAILDSLTDGLLDSILSASEGRKSVHIDRDMIATIRELQAEAWAALKETP